MQVWICGMPSRSRNEDTYELSDLNLQSVSCLELCTGGVA